MTLEEAGEIVLQGTPWVACTLCSTIGRIKVFGLDYNRSRGCLCCNEGGYYLSGSARLAYEMTGSTLPPKPPTLLERAYVTVERMMKNPNYKPLSTANLIEWVSR